MTLTAAADTPALTSGNDTITATTLNTFGAAADQIVDLGGTDTMNAFISAAPTAGTVVSGVENVNLTLAANVALNQSMFAGTTAFGLSGTVATTATFTNVTGGATFNLGTTTVLGTTGSSPNLTLSSAAATATDAATVNLLGGVSSTINTDPNGDATNINRLTLDSAGATANAVALAAAFTPADTTITVTGAQQLTISGVNADLTATTIGGGAHTGDLIVAQTDNTANLNAANYTGVDVISFRTAIAGAHAVSGLAAGTIVEVLGVDLGNNLTATLANAAGTSDAMTIRLNDADITGNIVPTGTELLTINSVGTPDGGANVVGGTIALASTAATETLFVTGTANLTVTGQITADGIDASNFSGNFVMGAAAAAATAGAGIKGGSGNDTLLASGTGTLLQGNAGNDSIVGGAGADIIQGGTGNDTITGAAGADTMSGGDGTDTFIIANNTSVARTAVALTDGAIANNDTITFGNSLDRITDFVIGTDKLDVTNAATAPTALFGMDPTGAALTVNQTYFLVGTWNEATGVFTVNNAATTATANVATLVLQATANDADAAAQTGWVLLTGIAGGFTGADFV